MPIISQKNGYPVKYIGDALPKDVTIKELYVCTTALLWLLRKNHADFSKELKRGVYNGIKVRRLTSGWVYNFHDILRFLFPYASEDTLVYVTIERLDEYSKVNKKFKKYYLE
jgi:hypothetical protein